MESNYVFYVPMRLTIKAQVRKRLSVMKNYTKCAER